MKLSNLLQRQASPYVPLGFSPDWGEGESLYGWCSRTHGLHGSKTRDFGAMLFGREHACRMVDLPCGLDRFVAATAGRLGGVEQLLLKRTVVSAYWPFADDFTREKVLDSVTDSFGTPAAQLLGLTASRLRALHPLRSCPDCMRESRSNVGYATWLLRQQLPGVWWCSEHQRPLGQVPEARAIWHTPGWSEVPLGAPESPDEVHALETMRALAEALPSLGRVNSDCFSQNCLRRLRDLGLVMSSARISVKRMNEWLEQQPLMQWIRRQRDAISFPRGNWAVPMLRARSRQHPLHWMVLWVCLWQQESVERATAAFVESANGQQAIEPGDQMLLWSEDRTRQLRVAIPEAVDAAFKCNQTIRGVAKMLGVSVGSVQSWLSERPDYERGWHEGIHLSRLAKAKEQMMLAVDANPLITRSELLLRCATEAAWLRANAPRTLRRVLDRLPRHFDPQKRLF